jgi:hypothetical protein
MFGHKMSGKTQEKAIPNTIQAGTNPHSTQPKSLAALARSLWRNRQFIVQMTKREVVGRE